MGGSCSEYKRLTIPDLMKDVGMYTQNDINDVIRTFSSYSRLEQVNSADDYPNSMGWKIGKKRLLFRLVDSNRPKQQNPTASNPDSTKALSYDRADGGISSDSSNPRSFKDEVKRLI